MHVGTPSFRATRRPPSPQPFVDEDQPVLRLFPPPFYALAVPVFAGVALWSAALLTLGAFLAGPELCK